MQPRQNHQNGRKPPSLSFCQQFFMLIIENGVNSNSMLLVSFSNQCACYSANANYKSNKNNKKKVSKIHAQFPYLTHNIIDDRLKQLITKSKIFAVVYY